MFALISHTLLQAVLMRILRSYRIQSNEALKGQLYLIPIPQFSWKKSLIRGQEFVFTIKSDHNVHVLSELESFKNLKVLVKSYL